MLKSNAEKNEKLQFLTDICSSNTEEKSFQNLSKTTVTMLISDIAGEFM